MKLSGRWFPQMVDRDSGNLYPLCPPYLCFDPKGGGGVGVGGGVKKQNVFFRKTIISHFMFSSRLCYLQHF